MTCRVFTSDLLEAVTDRRYDLVAVRPPFHSGKQTNYQIVQALIQQSLERLNPGGKLVLVANLFLRYENLIQAQFGNAQHPGGGWEISRAAGNPAGNAQTTPAETRALVGKTLAKINHPKINMA